MHEVAEPFLASNPPIDFKNIIDFAGLISNNFTGTSYNNTR
jgi:hypothetical protein